MKNLTELNLKEIESIFGGAGVGNGIAPFGYSRRTLVTTAFVSAIAGYIIIPRVVSMLFLVVRKIIEVNKDTFEESSLWK